MKPVLTSSTRLEITMKQNPDKSAPPRKARHTDHELEAFGNLFVKYRLGRALGITFECFMRAPHYYLRRDAA